MKILLYTEGLSLLSKSGIGKAITHQAKALELNNISYTLNKNEDYNIVHINTYGLKSYLLAKKAKKKGKKVIIHAHSTEEDFRDSFFFSNWIAPLFKKLLIKVYSQADHIITPTPYSKKLLESYNINAPIEFVSNGVDIDKFKKDPKQGDKFRKAYGFNSDDKIIMCVGLHIKRKGILDFIELAKRMPEYQFVWCGYTNPSLIPKEVRTLIKSPPKNAHFLGYVDDMSGPYSGCDLFLMLSHEETEGIVVLEALSSKQNIIVRDIGVYECWLLDKVNCYKASNNDEFEYLIRSQLNGKLNILTENGYKVVEERTLNNVGKKLKSIYVNTLVGA